MYGLYLGLMKASTGLKAVPGASQNARHQAISISDEKEIPLAIDWEKCRHCESHECVDACLQEAFVPASRDMKVSELVKIFDL